VYASEHGAQAFKGIGISFQYLNGYDGLYTALLIKVFAYLLALRLQAQ